MAYSDDAVKAKLSSLNETQDSIVANAQWIMFHRRYADRTASLWLTRLQESNQPKRLNLIYLANEVVQQSRARSRQDFMLAFEPIIADATALAYKGSGQEVQGKLRRVVDVWRQRGIFDQRIIESVDARLEELDRQRGGKGKAGGGAKLGGSLFGGGGSGGVPLQLEGVSKSLAALTKSDVSKGPALDSANVEYAKMTDADTPMPTPPVHAARLSALMRNLATAHGALDASIKARRELLAGLEKLIETHRSELAEDETALTAVAARRENVEARKKEVEDGIMRGLSANSLDADDDAAMPASGFHGAADGRGEGNTNGNMDPERPETEAFTPPPPDVESFTPPPQAPDAAMGELAPGAFEDAVATDAMHADASSLQTTPPALEAPPILDAHASAAAAANAFLNSLTLPAVRQASGEIPAGALGGSSGDPRLKRRKMSHNAGDREEHDIFGGTDGGTGVDEDGVAALLGP